MKEIYVHFIIFVYNVNLGWGLEQFSQSMYVFFVFLKVFWLQSTINGAKQSLFSKFPTVSNLRALSFSMY